MRTILIKNFIEKIPLLDKIHKSKKLLFISIQPESKNSDRYLTSDYKIPVNILKKIQSYNFPLPIYLYIHGIAVFNASEFTYVCVFAHNDNGCIT